MFIYTESSVEICIHFSVADIKLFAGNENVHVEFKVLLSVSNSS
jgi:hypothetical protein